ncbi:MAG: phage holin family protein [Gammaproteobacteria bacterium]|jgi:putative membrane protein|nr:phage holin family protein [Gammaproteobacteria bacterium]
MDRFLIRALVAALGLWVADGLIDGISFDSVGWLLGSAIVLGVINAIVRPLALVLTLPITVVTLGLFLLVLNAGMLALASWLVAGFHIAGFWAAFWGSIVVSLVSGLGSWFFGPKGGIEISVRRG